MATNQRLRGSIVSAGLRPAELAERIGVDAKTVERWITKGRLPHRTHRVAVASALGVDEAYIWPEVVDCAGHAVRERRRAPGAPPDPRRDAERHLDPADERRRARPSTCSSTPARSCSSSTTSPRRHPQKAAAGRSGSDSARRRDRAGCGASRRGGGHHWWACRGASSCTAATSDRCTTSAGVEVRTHGTTLYNTLYRFDQDMLVNGHAYGAPANESPILHLRRVPGGRMWDHYMRSFECVWTAASA